MMKLKMFFQLAKQKGGEIMRQTVSILIAIAVLIFAVSSQTLATPVIPLPPPDPNFFIRLVMFLLFG